MPAPIFVSSVPTNGATGTPKNVTLKVTFDTALKTASVTPQTVVLYNTLLNTRIECALSLSADGKTINIVPSQLLIPNSAHRLRVIGADISTTCVKSAGDDNLALTRTIVFSTGDTVEVETGEKTTDLIEGEGDLTLPDDVQLVGATPLRLISSTPKNHTFGIDLDTKEIRFRFSAALDPTTVTGNVEVLQYAFYNEDDLRAVRVDLGQGVGLKDYFRIETGDYTGEPAGFLDPNLFSDLPGYPSVDGDDLVWNLSSERDLPKNLCLEVNIRADIADTDGNVLGEDLIWFGCTDPYPDWQSILSIRHQVGQSITGTVPDDFVGMQIWQTTIDLLRQFRWVMNSARPSPQYQMWVRYSVGLALWDELNISKALSAGTSKRLGDLEISVNTAAASARPRRIKWMEEQLDLLRRQIWGFYTQTPRTGVKSALDDFEPGRDFFRARLWRRELAYNDIATPATAANTALQRYQGTSVLQEGSGG